MMDDATLAELIEHHKAECMKWSRSGFCSTRACLIRGGWKPGGAPARYEVARCISSDTVDAIERLCSALTPARGFPVCPEGEMMADPEWMRCGSRAPWVTNSIKHRIAEFKKAERSCRRAFDQEWMGAPANYLGDVYGELVEVLERHYCRIDALSPTPVRAPELPKAILGPSLLRKAVTLEPQPLPDRSK